jgi:hypothetical protein
MLLRFVNQVLKCEADDCTAQSPPIVSDTPIPTVVRQHAWDNGWGTLNGMDLCPDHVVVVAKAVASVATKV